MFVCLFSDGTFVYRSCNTEKYNNTCSVGSRDGIAMNMCYCDTDGCNGAGGISRRGLSLVVQTLTCVALAFVVSIPTLVVE